MGAHGLVRDIRVVPLDRLENACLVILAACRAALDTKDLHALFAEKSHNGINQ
jgi:hypothetical protein